MTRALRILGGLLMTGGVYLSACSDRQAPATTNAPPECPGSQVGELRTEAVQVFYEVSLTAGEEPAAPAGSRLRLIASFDPVVHYMEMEADGTIARAGFAPDDLHPVVEMRICRSIDSPCRLEEGWSPFVLAEETEITVDWVGARTFWMVVQFRDASGEIIPSFEDPYRLSDETGASLVIEGLPASQE